MKSSRLLFTKKILSVALIAVTCLLSGMTIFAEMTVAQSSRKSIFKCQSKQGIYRTIRINTSNGRETVFIIWNSGGLGGYNDNKRCEIVTNRLQRLSKLGQLRYFTYGKVNEQKVICGIASEKEGCFNPNMLYTLHAGANPIRKVVQFQELAIGQASSPVFETESGLYLDVEKYLDSLESSEIKSEQILTF